MPCDLAQDCIYKAGLLCTCDGFGNFDGFIDDCMLARLWVIDKLEGGDADDVEQFGWYPFDGAIGEFS
ncbi:MAG: hypothetical protein AMJ43_11340 [Coxiella sp. DG_40]|nr:MAG: hypothetical protein AMJ43_11340 [Coxiella sp. DG_40]